MKSKWWAIFTAGGNEFGKAVQEMALEECENISDVMKRVSDGLAAQLYSGFVPDILF